LCLVTFAKVRFRLYSSLKEEDAFNPLIKSKIIFFMLPHLIYSNSQLYIDRVATINYISRGAALCVRIVRPSFSARSY